MKPYSRREIRGLILLALICLLCVGIGVLSRQGLLTRRAPATGQSVNMAPTTPKYQPDSTDKSSKGSPSHHKKRGKSRKSRSVNSPSVKSQSPARDVLSDTIPS